MSEKPSRGRPAAVGVATAAALTLAVAIGWEAVAPTPVVERAGDVLVSSTVEEFSAAQDASFALLGLAAGVVHALVLLAAGRAGTPRAAIAAVAAAAVASPLAWQLGALLGPPAPEAQTDAVLRAPLTLHAYGVLGIWPATVAAVLFAAHLATALRTGMSGAGDVRHDRLGQPHQVGGGQLDVQPTPPGADQHRRM
ncbi:MAG: hypothetical protein ACLGIV_07040 [Actinomycetes bacterium]